MASLAMILSSFLPKPLLVRHEVIPKAFECYGGGARRIRCSAGSATSHQDLKEPTIRRSANYKPSFWDFDRLQSFPNEYSGPIYEKRLYELKVQVKLKLNEEEGSVYYLELIDDLQRLGISYHFDDEIYSILERMHAQIGSDTSDLRNQDLYATSLLFRLLRQHHFDVSQDVFDRFMDAKGDFDASLCEDTKGLVQLYEASFYLKENEKILELGKDFSGKHLNIILNEKKGLDQELKELVLHALDTPFHWRLPRLEAREFINLYEKSARMDPTILEFAKLDFNIVQAMHINELKYASKWWKETNLAEKLPFSRDRVVENFLWTIGIAFEPQHGHCRRMSVKINALITTVDDIYDVYGTLEELELFTEAVERWDIKETYKLPEYMKHFYLELYNTVNQTAYVFLQEQGIDISSYLRKSWVDICRAYLKEAEWYYSGYIPTLQEYLENGWISISSPLGLVHAYFFVTNPVEQEAMECLNTHHPIIRLSAMILRLADDLGTSPEEVKRGDVPKSIQLYMNETGASEEEAREHIKFLIGELSKQINKEVSQKDLPFKKTFIKIAMNVPRTGQFMYQHGDGHGHQESITKSRIAALLFKPTSLAS